MKISLRLLREDFPQAVQADCSPKELDLEFVDLTYLDHVHLEGAVEKLSETLIFRGQLSSQIEHTCARCLKQVKEHLTKPFEFVYDIKGKEEVDTLEDIRETLILDHPIRYLCQESCRGLCSQCGKDLNEGPCVCP